MSGFSCPSCGSTSTSAARCCGKPMGSYDAVNATALSVASGDRVLSALFLGAQASTGRRS
jgi:hypothetical protein